MTPRKFRALVEEFRRGIASALGVSPEDIRPELVEKWAREWARAFLTPEAFRRIWGHSSPSRVENATRELFTYVFSMIKRRPETKTKKGL